ncbi:hypothetical protein JL721_9279 [Aureococcus anophagefferens]|nr:hypothetical protein JL721_9279 [Aureococcus anophagefferens]
MYDGEEPDDDDFDVQLACICQRVGERVEYSLERLLYYFDNGDELIEHLGLDEPIEFQIGNVQHGDEVYFDTVRVGEETRRRFVAAWLRLKARGFPPPDLTLCACHCCDVLDSVTGIAGFGLFQADDRAYAVACVNIHGETLSYFSHRLRDDVDLVKQAVRRSPAALGFASKRLRDDESVALAARAAAVAPQVEEDAARRPGAAAAAAGRGSLHVLPVRPFHSSAPAPEETAVAAVVAEQYVFDEEKVDGKDEAGDEEADAGAAAAADGESAGDAEPPAPPAAVEEVDVAEPDDKAAHDVDLFLVDEDGERRKEMVTDFVERASTMYYARIQSELLAGPDDKPLPWDMVLMVATVSLTMIASMFCMTTVRSVVDEYMEWEDDAVFGFGNRPYDTVWTHIWHLTAGIPIPTAVSLMMVVVMATLSTVERLKGRPRFLLEFEATLADCSWRGLVPYRKSVKRRFEVPRELFEGVVDDILKLKNAASVSRRASRVLIAAIGSCVATTAWLMQERVADGRAFHTGHTSLIIHGFDAFVDYDVASHALVGGELAMTTVLVLKDNSLSERHAGTRFDTYGKSGRR